jgi:hypothetical protein
MTQEQKETTIIYIYRRAWELRRKAAEKYWHKLQKMNKHELEREFERVK